MAYTSSVATSPSRDEPLVAERFRVFIESSPGSELPDHYHPGDGLEERMVFRYKHGSLATSRDEEVKIGPDGTVIIKRGSDWAVAHPASGTRYAAERKIIDAYISGSAEVLVYGPTVDRAIKLELVEGRENIFVFGRASFSSKPRHYAALGKIDMTGLSKLVSRVCVELGFPSAS